MTSEKLAERQQAQGFLREAVLLLPRMVQLLYRLLGDPRVARADKVLVAAVVFYVALPADLLPDILPGIGQFDDLAAVSLVLLRLIANSGEQVVREHWTGSQCLVTWIHRVSEFSHIFLPDSVLRPLHRKFGSRA